MADTHYDVDPTKPAGRMHKDVMRNLRKAWDDFANLREEIIQDRLGDGGQVSDYANVATRYGYDSTAEASASFGEIDSAFGGGNAAIDQMLNRHLP